MLSTGPGFVGYHDIFVHSSSSFPCLLANPFVSINPFMCIDEKFLFVAVSCSNHS
jgi:hypothetical protein